MWFVDDDGNSQGAAPRVGQEERTSGPQEVARSPGIGGSSSTSSSSSSSISEPPCLDNAGSEEQWSPATRLSAVNVPTVSSSTCSTSIPAPSRPAWHHDNKLEAPAALPTSAPHGEGDEAPRGLQQGTGSDTGGGPGSSKKSPTRWHLRSFFPTKAFKPEGPP